MRARSQRGAGGGQTRGRRRSLAAQLSAPALQLLSTEARGAVLLLAAALGGLTVPALLHLAIPRAVRR
jgi:hypothetical protein